MRAYNDALAEWREVSDRYVPLAIIPYMSGIEVTVAEVQRPYRRAIAASSCWSSRARTSRAWKHFNDPYWDPLWATCQTQCAHSLACRRWSAPDHAALEWLYA